MNIIGINAFHADSSACLIIDGKLISAVEEERFNRIKHWAGFPIESIKYCLKESNLDLNDIEHHYAHLSSAFHVSPFEESHILSVDGSGRLQTVYKDTNEKYYNLIKEFYNITNIPILLNTSFNENEAIVSNPQEALNCFLRTRMDIIVLNNYLVTRFNI